MKQKFVCQECGYVSFGWLGRCPGCGEWNTMVEELSDAGGALKSKFSKAGSINLDEKIVDIRDVVCGSEARFSVGILELDELLGGGMVQDAVILLGGEPGIGKSTLSLEICKGVCSSGRKVLYVSGEESVSQVKMRAERLNVVGEGMFLLSETDVDIISGAVEKIKPSLVVIDSIQTVFTQDVSSSAGSVAQVRECSWRLSELAKRLSCSMLIIGHVTKDGTIAGPRTLEHLVDVVLYFEGQRYEDIRLLRAVKNRFGSTNEICLFEMTSSGLIPVKDASSFFVSQYSGDEVGVCVGAIVEGSRVFLVEVQALISPTYGVGIPARRVSGMDPNRLSLVLAVLEKRIGYKFYQYDVFVNVAGGMKIKDPALDLPIAFAIISSLKDTPVKEKTLAIGEIGLTGKVRSVPMMDKRIKEARKLGFENIVWPQDKVGVDLIELLEKVGL